MPNYFTFRTLINISMTTIVWGLSTPQQHHPAAAKPKAYRSNHSAGITTPAFPVSQSPESSTTETHKLRNIPRDQIIGKLWVAWRGARRVYRATRTGMSLACLASTSSRICSVDPAPAPASAWMFYYPHRIKIYCS